MIHIKQRQMATTKPIEMEKHHDIAGEQSLQQAYSGFGSQHLVGQIYFKILFFKFI